jgi:hypothetical protein
LTTRVESWPNDGAQTHLASTWTSAPSVRETGARERGRRWKMLNDMYWRDDVYGHTSPDVDEGFCFHAEVYESGMVYIDFECDQFRTYPFKLRLNVEDLFAEVEKIFKGGYGG